MKNLTLLVIACFLGLTVTAQSLTPSVVASSGEHFENPNNSISFTLGEVVTETYSNGSTILTQGFQQAVDGIIITGIDLDLMVFLEGPFNGAGMSLDLTGLPEFPLNQPYNVLPWNYSGSESVVSIPANVVDWLLIELRDATDAISATPATNVDQKAAFLLNDGSVVSTDGSSILSFDHSIIHSLFVVIWHRNHLGIMSSNGVTETEGIYTYDFSSTEAQVYGSADGHKQLAVGIWGMIAGDGTADGIINSVDKSEWATQAGTAGYLMNDYSMNGQVNNQDKNDKWLGNINEQTQVPQ